MKNPVSAPTIDEVGLSPDLAEHLLPQHGLVIFAGLCGQGISTLQAALTRHAAERPDRRLNIIRISEADSFDFSGFGFGENRLIDKIVDTPQSDISSAIGWALRRRPDMVSVDSLDDGGLEHALEIALTGHLVHLSRHGDGIIDTLRRQALLVDPADLAFALRAVVSQSLVPRADGKGKVAVHEILVVDPELSVRLGQADPHLWPAIIGNPQEVEASGRYPSTFISCCRKFYGSGIISFSEAARICGAGFAD